MLKIRLKRIGRRNQPAFRLVVIDGRFGPKSNRFIESIGSYNPITKETNIDAERVKHWLSIGAQPSDTVHNMLITAGITTGDKKNVLPRKSPVAQEATPEAQEETEEKAPTTETKIEETEKKETESVEEASQTPEDTKNTEEKGEENASDEKKGEGA